MKLDTFKAEYSVCSKCGRQLTAPKECAGIAADIDIPLCDACYQTVLFPDIKDYDCDILDFTCLT